MALVFAFQRHTRRCECKPAVLYLQRQNFACSALHKPSHCPPPLTHTHSLCSIPSVLSRLIGRRSITAHQAIMYVPLFSVCLSLIFVAANAQDKGGIEYRKYVLACPTRPAGCEALSLSETVRETICRQPVYDNGRDVHPPPPLRAVPSLLHCKCWVCVVLCHMNLLHFIARAPGRSATSGVTIATRCAQAAQHWHKHAARSISI